MLFLVVRKVNDPQEIPVRTQPFMKTGQFLQEILTRKNWPEASNLYCVELERFLDLEGDFLENRIVPGDHLIAF